jgi:hypothetical protein
MGIGIKEVSFIYLLEKVISVPTSIGASAVIIILASRYVVYGILYSFLVRSKEK